MSFVLNTRDAVELRRHVLPEGGAGGGYVSILRQPDGQVLVKRFVSRGSVVNIVDRYEQIVGGQIEVLPLDESAANQIVDSVLTGKPWSACFVIGDVPDAVAIPWERSEAEHRFTSTGVKFWRHREAMESYRAGTGRTVISTHISPEGSCNLHCGYCSVNYRETHSRIALPRIQKYITDLKSRGLKAAIITGGGESTLYPEFNELVQWLKAEGLSVALITNGTNSKRVQPDTWKCFSWVRVSINIFDGWREKITLPQEQLSSDCVVGCSFVYTLEHEATSDEVPLDRIKLFGQVSQVATECGAKYIRVLPNCLLPQAQLLLEHRSIQSIAERLGDARYFHQYKVHAAPRADFCHQSVFRPYLSEEPFHGGEPGTVYPCDSVVLNDSVAHFAEKYQLCRPEDILDYMDRKIEPGFSPAHDCAGCVFTSNVNMLDDYATTGEGHFTDEPLVHEDFI